MAADKCQIQLWLCRLETQNNTETVHRAFGLNLKLPELGRVGRVRYLQAIIREKTYRYWQIHKCISL